MGRIVKTENPTQAYGDQRRKWSSGFESYMKSVIQHENFFGMPDAIDSEGVMRWNAPSNRPPGRWQDLRDRRLAWWRQKAVSFGIPQVGGWISKVVKRNHPFNEKPCQTCGRVMFIGYVYPTRRTLQKLNSALSENDAIAFSDFKTIYEVVPFLLEKAGVRGLEKLIDVFPELNNSGKSVDELLGYFRHHIVPSEPKGRLSPGSMSNAPDRLDGFHSYNLCCRSGQDTGRSADNLRTYSDDRRAFEFWCEGDWAAASLLMTMGGVGVCAECGRTAKMTADHVGPISLGFKHSPKFRPLCGSCNSTKGNRLTLRDTKELVEDEKSGDSVVSFQIKQLWDLCKNGVETEDDAKRLCNLLRINQHYYLRVLKEIFDLGYPDLLLERLHPEYAREKISIVGLNASNFEYKEIQKTKRADSYSNSKACRAIRISFEALDDYSEKAKRNIHEIPAEIIADSHKKLLNSLPSVSDTAGNKFRQSLSKILRNSKMDEKQKIQKLNLLFKGNFSARGNFPMFDTALKNFVNTIGSYLAGNF